jgi:hypothetical protein
MARTFTTDQLDLLYSGAFKVRTCVQFNLDSGAAYFCDDMDDLFDGTNTWVGANAIMSLPDIKSSVGWAAESCQFVVDGNRYGEATGQDPGYLFASVMNQTYHQRRVSFFYGVAPIDSFQLSFLIPIYQGLINNIKVVDQQFDFLNGGDISGSGTTVASQMVVTVDTLALRYSWSTYRTRSHTDQLDLNANDSFFIFTNTIVANELNLFWGRSPPTGVLPIYLNGKYVKSNGNGVYIGPLGS